MPPLWDTLSKLGFSGDNTVSSLLVCISLSVCLRFNGSTREAFFSVGLQGIAEENIDTVKQIIARTIDKVIE